MILRQLSDLGMYDLRLHLPAPEPFPQLPHRPEHIHLFPVRLKAET